MITPEEIVAMADERLYALGSEFVRMRRIKEVMNCEIALPLPELHRSEEPAVANLALQGQDNLARRIASVDPTMFFPSMGQGSQAANDRARDRLRVTQGWHSDNHMKRKLSKRARYFLSYATAPVCMMPNPTTGRPHWHIRDPLATLPATTQYDDFTPPNVIFITTHTYGSLRERYPQQALAVQKPMGWDYQNDYANYNVEFDVYEYIDHDEVVMILRGAKAPDGYPQYGLNGAPAMLLHRAVNRVGRCLAVIPGRITLDAQLGHFDGIIGMYQTQAALMALTVVAQRRTVWPREWLVARPNETPQVISIPNPVMGEPGELEGGDLQVQNLDPSFRVLEVMDRLGESMQRDAGLPSEFGGVSGGDNVRTGRRGAQVMGAAINFTIAEAQDLFAEALVEENKLAIAIDKAYFPKSKTYQIATRSYAGNVTYTPSKLWETDQHVVDWPLAGTDMQNLPIEGGQRVAMGTLSRQGFMEIDPMIKDATAEIQRMDREGVKQAWFSGLQQVAAMPDSPMQLTDFIDLDSHLDAGMPLFQAFKKVQEAAQSRQATPAPTPEAAQPGVAMPGQGVEQPEAIPEQDTSMNRLTQLLGSLGTAQAAQKFRGNN